MSERIKSLIAYKKCLWILFGSVSCNVPASKYYRTDKIYLGQTIYRLIKNSETLLELSIKLKQKTEYEKQVIRFVVVLEVFLVKSAHLLIGGFYD